MTTHPRRISGLVGAGLLLAAGVSCQQARLPLHTELWRVVTNTCQVTYRHVWSDVAYTSDLARAEVVVLVPVAAMMSDLDHGAEQAAEAEARQAETEQPASLYVGTRSAEAHADEAVTRQRETGQETALTAHERAAGSYADAETGAQRSLRQEGASFSADRQAAQAGQVRRGAMTGDSQSGAQAELDYPSAQTTEARTTRWRAGEQEANWTADSRQGDSTSVAQRAVARLRAEAAAQASREQRAEAQDAAYTSRLATEWKQGSSAAEDWKGSWDLRAQAAALSTRAAYPELSVIKVAWEPEVLAGDRVRFLITLENTGPLELRDLVLTDTWSAGLRPADRRTVPVVRMTGTLPPGHRRMVRMDFWTERPGEAGAE